MSESDPDIAKCKGCGCCTSFSSIHLLAVTLEQLALNTPMEISPRRRGARRDHTLAHFRTLRITSLTPISQPLLNPIGALRVHGFRLRIQASPLIDFSEAFEKK